MTEPVDRQVISPAGESPAEAASGGLLRNRDFLKLWVGQTVSELGSYISRDGLPLLAVITLGASPSQMGLMTAIGNLPVLLFSMFAGVWVDRTRRRPLMIASEIGRALLLCLIPLAAVLGVLAMWHLYIITALTGILAVLFGIAYSSYLPGLVEREHILEGNSKLAVTNSATEVIGPGMTGLLVQLLTAPFAILFDALSFVVSAISIAAIRKPEPPPVLPDERQTMLAEASEGLHTVLQNPILRALTASVALLTFFGTFFGVLYGVYAIRVLEITPAALGLTIGVGGISSLLGALFAARIARRFGLGRTLIACLFLHALFNLLIPLAASVPRLGIVFLILAQLGDITGTIFFINSVSLRQSITPDRLLGRVSASMELAAAGIGPLGALAGGFLGEYLGIQQTLFIAVLGAVFAGLWLTFSPVRQLKEFGTLPVERPPA